MLFVTAYIFALVVYVLSFKYFVLFFLFYLEFDTWVLNWTRGLIFYRNCKGEMV